MYTIKIIYFEFDLSLTKIQYPIKNHFQTHVLNQTIYFEFDLSLTKIQFQLKTNTVAHVQSQTLFIFEFDLS